MFTTIVPATIISGIMIFVMFAATNVAGVVCVGVFYGFFSGVCEYVPFASDGQLTAYP